MRDKPFTLTAQEIIDEFTKRGMQLQRDTTTREPRVVIRTTSSSKKIPAWLEDRLLENVVSVVDRLTEIAVEESVRGCARCSRLRGSRNQPVIGPED